MSPLEQTTGVRTSPDRILCIRLSGLGDVVHAMNALSVLRKALPDAFIAWALEERFAGLLQGHPYIDELVSVPRGQWTAVLRNPLRWLVLTPELRELRRRLRAFHFNVSLDFQSSLKSVWLVWWAAAGLRIGFARPVNRELNWLFQNHRVKAPAAMHRIERDLALLKPLGIRGLYADAVLPVSDGAAGYIGQALDGRLTGGPLVVIHPGTSAFASFKRWSPDRYAALADRLVAERGADVLVTYGPDERGVAESVVGRMSARGQLSPPTPDLQQMTALLARAALFVGSDTGPMHVASALGVPVVALFGPKDPVQTGPYGSRAAVVTGRAHCRPCSRRGCRRVECMQTIMVDDVFRAAEAVLDGRGRRRADQWKSPGP